MRTASTRVVIAFAAVAIFGALGSSAGARVNQERSAAASGTLTVGVEGDPVVLDGALVEGLRGQVVFLPRGHSA